MNNLGILEESVTFTVPLTNEIYRVAEMFGRGQNDSNKARQVYLNTLAVYAVDFYCQCLDFETELENSDSWNPGLRSLMNVADLKVKDVGNLECIPVLKGASYVSISSNVRENRVGYVVVEIDEGNLEATLLGFVPEFADELLHISALNPLDDLIDRLEVLPEELIPPVENTLTVLSKWFQNEFVEDWRSLKELLSPEVALAYRTRDADQAIRRGKAIALGTETVVILIEGDRASEEKVIINVQLHPTSGEKNLPDNLKLAMLSLEGKVLQDVRSRKGDNYIQLKKFKGKPGMKFSIQVSLDDIIVTEDFVI